MDPRVLISQEHGDSGLEDNSVAINKSSADALPPDDSVTPIQVDGAKTPVKTA